MFRGRRDGLSDVQVIVGLAPPAPGSLSPLDGEMSGLFVVRAP